MEQVALYRKYRPQNFSEVLGQDHITNVLKNALKTKQISHAYLFSGPRGTGKTSVARILASELKTSPEDLYEIDGASNRGIDEIRALKEAVSTLPFSSPFKVYVIDEVHMLTKEAFNALLKTLEEPPDYVIFVLATTELHKVPDTIVSRCQQFTFKKPTEAILRRTIEYIAKKEKLSIDDDAVSLVAFLGDGSFRDAQGYLEQVLHVGGGKKITREDIEEVTGVPALELTLELTLELLNNNTKAALGALERASAQNVDMKVFAKLIMKYLRFAMLISFAPATGKRIEEEVGNDEFKKIEVLSKHKNSAILPEVLKKMIEVYEEIKYSYIQELPLELMIIRLTKKDD